MIDAKTEMKDAKTEVETLLKNSPALVALLGAKHVYQDLTTNAKQYPRIVLYEITTPDTDYADDMPQAYEPIIQVSIFHREKTLTIFNAVDAAMKAAGWRRTFNHEFYEEEEKIFHRPTRWKNKFLY